MNINTTRRGICEKCLIVSGLDESHDYEVIRVNFPDSLDGRKVISPGQDSSTSWILLFPVAEVAAKYIGKKITIGDKSVVVSSCDYSCDIPQDWLTCRPYSPWIQQPVLHPHFGMPYAAMPTYPFSTPHPNFLPNKELLEKLNNMGIPKDDSIKGLFMTGNRSVESAAEWIFSNQDALKNPSQQLPIPFQPHWQVHQPIQDTPPFNVSAVSSSPQKLIEQKNRTDVNESTSMERGEPLHDKKSTLTDVSGIVSEEINEHSKMINVIHLPDKTTEDNLTLFFENTRRSGGGDIVNIEYKKDDATAVITFKEEDVVERVIAKSPLQFMNTTIAVEQFTPKNQPIKAPLSDCGSEDSSEKSSLIVEVHGVKPSTQELTVQYYFESKKGADDDVENIEYIEDKDVYLLTFASEDAVAKVLSKHHTIETANLIVKKYIPPAVYSNKVIVQGLPDAVSEEELTNYIEGRTRQDVSEVNFSCKFNDTAVVTFEDHIDVVRVQEACNKKTFQHTNLKIKSLVVSNCIIVTEFSEKTTESSLEYYFDNKRRSGVEHVEEVQMKDNYCLIHFQNHEDAVNACMCPHIIDKCTLRVQIYYECLGPPVKEEASKNETTKKEDIDIQPLFFEDIDSDKLKCLIHSTKLRNLVEKEMEKFNSRVVWPSSEYGFISIEFTVQKDMLDYKNLAVSWMENAKDEFIQSLDAVTVEHCTTLSSIWDEVKSQITLLDYNEAHHIDVIFIKETCDIYIAGREQLTTNLLKKISLIIDNHTLLVQKENDKVEETLPLQGHQQQILEALHFTTDMSRLYPAIDISFSLGKPALELKGSIADISSVKSKMLEHISQIQQEIIGPKLENYVRFIEDSDIKTMIDKEIKDSGHTCVWDLSNNTIVIYTLSQSASKAIRRIFNKNIKETTFPIDEQNKVLLKSREWRKLRESIQEESRDQGFYTRIEEISDDKISVVCTSKNDLLNVIEKIRDFMFENSISDQTLPFTKQQMKVLKDRYKDKIDLITIKLERMKIEIKFEDSCIIITGNKKARKSAMLELEPIFKILKQNVSKDEVEPFVPFGLGHGSVVASYNVDEGQSIMVLCCDITDLGVDAIVSPADRQLSCRGGLSKMIVEEGGHTILKECSTHRRQHGPLKEAEVYTSGAGRLKCKAVIHVVGPVLLKLQSNEENVLAECVHSILRESDTQQYESVAIPALSCGAANFPVDEAVETIVYAVERYFKENDSSVKTVYFCDVAPKITDLFVFAGNRAFKRSSKRPVNQDFSPRSGSVATYVPQIKVVIQDLAKMKVNVIVNTTSTDLQLNKSGAVSSSLLKIGGITIQQQCISSYPSGIQYGQVAVTNGGQLQCSHIYHGALPQYERDGTALKILRQFVNQCMVTAQGHRFASIAFPSMGTGKLCYPPGQVADVMFDTVAQYYQSYPGYNPQEVYFCLFHRDFTTVKAFQDEEDRRKPKQSNRRKDRL